MPKPPVKNPGDEILSSEWNQGWDWMQEGSGSTTNCDKVDGRHAEPGVYPGVVLVDATEVTIPANFAGWLTIAYGDGKRSGIITLGADISSARHKVVFYASLRWGTHTQRRSILKMRDAVFYADGSIKISAVRMVYDPSDVIYSQRQIQVYVVETTGSARTISLRQIYHAGGGADIEEPWALGNVAQGSATAVDKVVGIWNGSWRLARSLSGTGAGVGYLSGAQMRDLFSDANASLTDDSCADAVAASRESYSAYYYFTADYPVALEGFKACVRTGGGSNNYRTQTVYLEYSTDNSNWHNAKTLSISTNNATKWGGGTFTRTIARYWRVRLRAGADYNGYLNEVSFYLSSSLVINGIPVGCTVKLLDSGGATLESVRLVDWEFGNYVLLTTNPASIAEIDITRPDGTTDWLKFPLDLDGTSTVDGGDLASGDVLTLYQES